MSDRSLRLVEPASAPDPDTTALVRIAQGNLQELGALYERHAPSLLRFARHVVGDSAAEDLVQSTFIKAAERAHTYDGRSSSARAWLFGIAGRLAQERRRALGRFARALVRFAAGSDEEPTTPVVPERSDLLRGLSGLSEHKRVVLLLSEVEGFTAVEIAEMLQVPVGTVWTRLHHARRELRAFYGDQA
ncbi:MAG: RNA polymerase sigma factor [Myxococcota bacterium]